MINCCQIFFAFNTSFIDRAFSHDVMAAILVIKINETEAMLVYQPILGQLSCFLL